MELGPSLAPGLVTALDPLSRGLPESLRPPGRAPDADAATAPFELLLKLLGNRLPDGLPGGQTLPVGGNALPTDAAEPLDSGALPLDSVAPIAAPLLLPLPLPPALEAPAAPAAAAAAAGAADVLAALDDAVRLKFATAPRPQVAVLAPASTAGGQPAAAVAADAAATTDAPAALPRPVEPPNLQRAMPADLDAALALDVARAAAPPAAEPFALRPRAADDSRARASAASPAERALSLATALARADAAATRADAPLALPLDNEAPAAAAAAAPVAVKITRFADGLPIDVASAPLGPDAATAGSSTVWAPSATLATNAATSAAAQPNAQLPGHLGSPVDTQAARWHDALASRIHWLVDHEIGEAQIKLNPPELGALDVKISILDDKTFVQMTAHTSAARDELAQSLPRLRELMSAGGLDLGGATVSGGRDDRSGYAAAAQPVTRAHAFASDSADLAADLSSRVRLGSSSRIDLFA